MIDVSENLEKILQKALPFLLQIADNEATTKPFPEKWSKKEIIGHLIDSACNNQQKFVRTMAQSHLDFVGYDQNHWVASQNYNTYDWKALLAVWQQYNLHIAHIIACVSSDKLDNTISIDGKGPFTLRFIMTDYVEHLVHHLLQILPDLNLENSFDDIYH